jgi:hypothetical protein
MKEQRVLTPDEVFGIVDKDRKNALQMQRERYDFIMTVPEMVVPSENTPFQAIKQLGADADIQIVKITGTFQEFDAAGNPLTTGFTDDIRMQIKDAGEGKTLTDYFRLSTVLSPGRVGNPKFGEYPFRHTFKKSNNIEFNCLYGNSNADYTCKVNLTFYGRKIKSY